MAQPDRQKPPARRGRRGVDVRADNLRELREQSGMTALDLAAKIGISRQHLYNLEGGFKKRTTAEVAHRIAAELKVEYEQIVLVAA